MSTSHSQKAIRSNWPQKCITLLMSVTAIGFDGSVQRMLRLIVGLSSTSSLTRSSNTRRYTCSKRCKQRRKIMYTRFNSQPQSVWNQNRWDSRNEKVWVRLFPATCLGVWWPCCTFSIQNHKISFIKSQCGHALAFAHSLTRVHHQTTELRVHKKIYVQEKNITIEKRHVQRNCRECLHVLVHSHLSIDRIAWSSWRLSGMPSYESYRLQQHP